MKTSFLKPALLLLPLALISVSCKTNILPKIHNPTYQSYNSGTEKGYYVDFELSHDSIVPAAVILNKIEQTISPESKSGLKYRVNVIAQSQKIFGFKPKVSQKDNGLIFKTDTADVYKAVDFKLKTK